MKHSYLSTLKEISQHFTVLYVEDDPTIMRSITKIFQMFFAQVDLATDGQEGLKLFQQKVQSGYHYDIVISDIDMPIMSGISMLKEIRKIDEQMPFIFLSAHSESHYLFEAIKNGVDAFITKPLDIVQLEQALFRVCMQIQDKQLIEQYIDKIEEQNMQLAKTNKELEKNIRLLDTMMKKELYSHSGEASSHKPKDQATISDIDSEQEHKRDQLSMLVKEDLHEMKELVEEMDVIIINLLDSDEVPQASDMQEISKLFERYGALLGFYSFLLDIGHQAAELSRHLQELPEQTFTASENGAFTLLESLVFVLSKWHTVIAEENESMIDFYEASIISDFQTINAILGGSESKNSLDEIFQF